MGKGYCPVCGVIPIIELGGLMYGERVRFFRCDKCGAEFGIFILNKENEPPRSRAARHLLIQKNHCAAAQQDWKSLFF